MVVMIMMILMACDREYDSHVAAIFNELVLTFLTLIKIKRHN
jgi:hypothetical protein